MADRNEHLVQAWYDGDNETWWFAEPEGTRTEINDVTGGSVRIPVSAALWAAHQAASKALDAARAQLIEAMKLDPTEMRFATVCDAYDGHRSEIGVWVYWSECDRCGWGHDDHLRLGDEEADRG